MLAHNQKLKDLWDNTPKKVLYEKVVELEPSKETEAFTKALVEHITNTL